MTSLYERSGQPDKAGAHYRVALDLAESEAERRFLLRKREHRRA